MKERVRYPLVGAKSRKKDKVDPPAVFDHTEVKNPAPWPDPTPEMLQEIKFNRIWECIKTWDINVPEVYVGYSGATGNHVRAILDALREPSERELGSWVFYIRVLVSNAKTELRIYDLVTARCEIQRIIDALDLNTTAVTFLPSKRDDSMPVKMQSKFTCNIIFEESLLYIPCSKYPTPEMIALVIKELEWMGLRVNQDFDEAANVSFVMIARDQEAVFLSQVKTKQFFEFF